MKQRLLIFFGIIFLIALLIGLNAVSFIQTDKKADTELKPNRSTYNGGATGARAFFDLLNETGRRSVRWQEPVSELSKKTGANRPTTFVIIGYLRRNFEETEAKDVLRWVEKGGRLVIIDREPDFELLPRNGMWKLITNSSKATFDANPADSTAMTKGIEAFKPIQPTIFTASVNAVQPSKFASNIELKYGAEADQAEKDEKSVFPNIFDEDPPPTKPRPTATPTPKPVANVSANSNQVKLPPFTKEKQTIAPPKVSNKIPPATPSTDESSDDDYYEDEDPPPSIFKAAPDKDKEPPPKAQSDWSASAPVVHLANNDSVLLADYPHGAGRIILLSDPYIVTNTGIRQVDNLQLAVNLVSTRDGLIAFDEFHQGYGSPGNMLFNYFSATPVLAILGQFALIVGLIVWANGRRFARALPLPNPDRRSKLEYVSAMAELQRRTRAQDLAIENIYSQFRRNLARFAGADNILTKSKQLAELVAERSKVNFEDLQNVMMKCENIIHGEPTNNRETLELVAKIREIEQILGFRKRQT